MRLKKTHLITKILILALAIYAVVTLVSLQSQIQEKRTEAADLAERVMYAEQEQLVLQEDIDKLDTDEGIIKIARERLGMVADGEVVFYDSNN